MKEMEQKNLYKFLHTYEDPHREDETFYISGDSIEDALAQYKLTMESYDFGEDYYLESVEHIGIVYVPSVVPKKSTEESEPTTSQLQPRGSNLSCCGQDQKEKK